MANIKISELTPKGSNLASTDLLEISQSAGGGTYVTKSITGAQIIAAAGGVTSVSGTAPIASTGGTTPTISIATANTSTTGALTSTDWNTFNGKQAPLVSGTNIKTINSTSVLGSGNIAVQPTLVSGTNIKTINGNSVLGSGNITISGGGTNPTSGFIPVNNSGVFADSPLSVTTLTGPTQNYMSASDVAMFFLDGVFGGQVANLNGNFGAGYIGSQPQGLFIGYDLFESAMSAGSAMIYTGTHTTISKWLKVVDENLNTFYLPLYL
jgi:hypothetical protein